MLKISLETLQVLARHDNKANQCFIELVYRELTTPATYEVYWKRSTDLYHIAADGFIL